MLLYVLSHWRSGPKCFITGVAWHNDSFKVICFNMIFDGSSHAFFCTHFALVKELFSIGVFVLTFLHRRLHYFFKVVQVCIIEARDCNCRTVFRFSVLLLEACLFEDIFEIIEVILRSIICVEERGCSSTSKSLIFYSFYLSNLWAEVLQQTQGTNPDSLVKHLLLPDKESPLWQADLLSWPLSYRSADEGV